MIQTVDIFKQIAANLTANVVIDAAIDNLDGTFTLETTNTQWISEFEIYSIGGFDYKIESLVQNESLTISPVSNGVLPTATGFVIPAPTFINGTLKMAQNEVTAIKNKMNLVPFIYLYEVIRDRKNTDDESTVERECDLRFFFINSSSFKDMLTEDVYEKVIYPLHPLVEMFITKIKASPLFTDVLNYDEINLINFSEEGNQNKSIFDLNLSAIELRLQAEIRSVNCDDIYTNPNPTCLPVRITDENVVVEVAAGMAYTCANSEPCEPIRVTFDNYLIEETSTDLNIDCSTYLNMAIVTGDGLDGNYIDNGSNQYDLGNIDEWKIIYITDRWSITDISDNLLAEANVGAEAYPWLAIWSTITVEEGTIENYCGGGTAPDGEFYINLVKVADVPSGGNASTFVTLDGVNAGTYDSINNIWEVVSNPCSDATYTIKDSANTTLYSGSIASGGDLQQTITDSTVNVRKSDNTLISAVAVEAQGTDSYVVSDSTVTVNGNAYANVKATDSLDVAVEYVNGTPVGTINAGVVEIPNPITQSGIAYQRPSLTGQLTSYRTGDDAWNLANGVYDYTPPTYPTSFAKLDLAAVSPFTTLLHNNAFGNKDRFTDDAGGQTYANDYVIDHLTGLGYYRIVQGASNNWDTNIDNAVASTQGGFTDWRVCNFQEYDIIADRSMVAFNYSPFNINGSPTSVFQTSTTRNDTTTHYIRYQITTYVQSVSELKSTALSSRGVLYVRNHYN